MRGRKNKFFNFNNIKKNYSLLRSWKKKGEGVRRGYEILYGTKTNIKNNKPSLKSLSSLLTGEGRERKTGKGNENRPEDVEAKKKKKGI